MHPYPCQNDLVTLEIILHTVTHDYSIKVLYFNQQLMAVLLEYI